jgi:hypothetical protein
MTNDPSDSESNLEADYDLDEDRSEGAQEAGPVEVDARMAIAGAAFDAATTSSVRRRLRNRKNALAVVVRMPTPAWVKPIGAYFAKAFGDAWERVARDGTRRPLQRDEQGSEDVARDLADGRSVVGISADLNLLPATCAPRHGLRVACAPLNRDRFRLPRETPLARHRTITPWPRSSREFVALENTSACLSDRRGLARSCDHPRSRDR